MKYALVNQYTKNAMRLQGVGVVLGTPAKEIKKGDFLMWDFGHKSQVIEIVKETEKTITIKEKICESNYIGERKLLKSRLVCILK